jgi:hypothetical protein
MEAKVTDRLWDVSDLALLEACHTQTATDPAGVCM